MTAPGVSPRSNEEIRADVERTKNGVGIQAPLYVTEAAHRLLADVPALLVEREDQDRRIEQQQIALDAYRKINDAQHENCQKAIAAARYQLARAERAEAERDALAAERDELRAKVAAVEAARDALQLRHATMRTALSFVRRWPDDVTGKGMVDADDILTILDADRRAALAAASPGDEEKPKPTTPVDDVRASGGSFHQRPTPQADRRRRELAEYERPGGASLGEPEETK